MLSEKLFQEQVWLKDTAVLTKSDNIGLKKQLVTTNFSLSLITYYVSLSVFTINNCVYRSVTLKWKLHLLEKGSCRGFQECYFKDCSEYGPLHLSHYYMYYKDHLIFLSSHFGYFTSMVIRYHTKFCLLVT